MSIELSQITQQLPLRLASPQLVAANHILSLSSAELQAAIQREVSENPAMEMEEAPVCERCGRPLQHGRCLECGRLPGRNSTTTDERTRLHGGDGAYYDMGGYGAPGRGAHDDGDDFDPSARIASQISLTESLTLSLQAQFPKEDAQLIEYLVGNLDEDGYLRCATDDVVRLFDIEPEPVERIIQALQAMEPIGVGARDLRECLLIQLAYIEAQGRRQPYAREVIGRFLVELSEHKYGQIAFALGTTTDSIHAVSDFIRRNFNPFPGRGRLDGAVTAGGETASPIAPDVIISGVTQPDGSVEYEVEIVESRRFYLRVHPSYEQIATAAGARLAALSEEERRHVHQYVSRARLFIANIRQRRETLARITRCLVSLQRDFLQQGVRALKPLTRARVAAELGLHESTVSRATASKYVMLPNGQVIPFSHFFVANLSVKDVIKDLIEHEATPLTDQEIAAQLRLRGLPVARRTVAKYREHLGILPSTLR